MNNLLLILFLGNFSINLSGQTITIGNQIWMTKNLNINKFRNGDSIPEAKTPEEWKIASDSAKPAWCYFRNKTENGVKYGKLYNWYAVNDSRGLAPIGFHVPNDEEWTKLENYLGYGAGKKMRSKTGWEDNTGSTYYNGTNESGFSGFQCGHRYIDGSFPPYSSVGGRWWSSTDRGNSSAGYIQLDVGMDNYINLSKDNKGRGFSVRCIKD